jgi:argininosuccinate lyase
LTEKGMMIRGRFETSLDEVMERINASIFFDREMFSQDIDGSLAHARMLAAQGIISAEDQAKIAAGLEQIRAEIVAGEFEFSTALEDIHMNVESRLTELIGEPAGRLHTARSRNDQVATDFKLWVRSAHDQAIRQLTALITALLDQAAPNTATIMPGFTHLQVAQPTTLGHHFLAYVEMLGRDVERMRDSRVRCNQSPLGAAALAGTSFPIDRDATAHDLGFDGPMRNSLDAVADRDFVLEFVSAMSISMIHLSRMAEEIVLWMSPFFNFITMSDAWTTGSSIMPQKRNPDAAELVRGKSGRVVGALNGLLMMMKGLPLTFSKDMQEDKEQTFQATEEYLLCLRAMTGMIKDLVPNTDRLEEAAGMGHATATDLADWLTGELGLPFRKSHHIVGSLVRLADRRGVALDALTLDEMQTVEPTITRSVFSQLGPRNSVASRTSFGGTAPANVMAQIAFWRDKISGWDTASAPRLNHTELDQA